MKSKGYQSFIQSNRHSCLWWWWSADPIEKGINITVIGFGDILRGRRGDDPCLSSLFRAWVCHKGVIKLNLSDIIEFDTNIIRKGKLTSFFKLTSPAKANIRLVLSKLCKTKIIIDIKERESADQLLHLLNLLNWWRYHHDMTLVLEKINYASDKKVNTP